MWVVGVDVGGTFTDVIAVNAATGEMRVHKVPTTLRNQADGFVSGLLATGVMPSDLDVIVHGTTTGTNAILERKGAVAGVITTRGFRDVLELGRRTRPHHFGLRGQFEPLVPRERRLEVTERLNALGEEILALDDSELRDAARQLEGMGCESLAISFLHSYVNSGHESRAADVVRQVWPNDYVSTSAEILPEIREFERTTAVTLNALLQPLISRYIGSLSRRLTVDGFLGSLLLVQANGGVMHAETARAEAIRTVLSGPAAGVTAAAHVGLSAGFRKVISADMGGTSFDVAMIQDGKPTLTHGKDLDFKVPLPIPSVDIVTIGQGGGSIAYVDRAGILRVGPESAGSEPGPIVYGRGGLRPTITDANVWLGRLNPVRIPSVDAHDTLDKVEKALHDQVALPLGLSVDEAAVAILRVANDAMAGAIRLVSTERGADPREFALLAFGGAGPLHAIGLARALGLPHVIIPQRPGVTSALGCIVADFLWTNVQSMPRALTTLAIGELTAVLRQLADKGVAEFARPGVNHEGLFVSYTLDIQYEGQFHVFSVDFDTLPNSIEEIAERAQAQYKERFGMSLEGIPLRLVTTRVSVTGKRPATSMSTLKVGTDVFRASSKRRAWFDGQWRMVQVLDRLTLGAGQHVRGPAILEQSDSTVVLEPNCNGRVDEFGNLIVEVHASGPEAS